MDTSTTTLYAAEVRHGAALLDERKPGWIDQIDLETLDLNDVERCILGQLYSPVVGCGYLTGLLELGIGGKATSYGFCTGTTDRDSYDELTDAWVSYIAERRAA